MAPSGFCMCRSGECGQDEDEPATWAPPMTAQQDPWGRGTAGRLSLSPELKAGLPVRISCSSPFFYPTPACQPGSSPPHAEKEQTLYSHFSWQEVQQVCRQQMHSSTFTQIGGGAKEGWRDASQQGANSKGTETCPEEEQQILKEQV